MAGKYPNGKGKPGRKREWKDMEITRVKLNPEQAVLTCCDTTNRSVAAYSQCSSDCNPQTGVFFPDS